EAQDGIAAPVAARDARAVEGDAFVQGPARRLQDAALKLVLDAVEIDRLTAVDRRDGALQAHATALPVELDLDRQGHIGGEVLVARERTAAAAAPLLLVLRPAKAIGGGRDDLAGARIIEMAQTEHERIGLRRTRKLV